MSHLRSNSSKWLGIIIFILSISTLNAQNDCLLYPLKRYLDTSKFVFVIKIDELIIDSIQAELKDILGNTKSKTAIGKVIKIFKGAGKELNYCDDYTVEWGYIFEKGKSYLVFCYKNSNGIFQVYSCSYSEPLTNGKRFNKMYTDLNKYYMSKELDWLMGRR